MAVLDVNISKRTLCHDGTRALSPHSSDETAQFPLSGARCVKTPNRIWFFIITVYPRPWEDLAICVDYTTSVRRGCGPSALLDKFAATLLPDGWSEQEEKIKWWQCVQIKNQKERTQCLGPMAVATLGFWIAEPDCTPSKQETKILLKNDDQNIQK